MVIPWNTIRTMQVCCTRGVLSASPEQERAFLLLAAGGDCFQIVAWRNNQRVVNMFVFIISQCWIIASELYFVVGKGRD